MKHSILLACLCPTFLGALSEGSETPVPFSGPTDPGVPFQLPQQNKFYNGRRSAIGSSNSLTISWDGRLVMYQDSGFELWDDETSFTRDYGYVFATFAKDEITLVDGRPNFEDVFGDPFPRFAALADDTPPNGGGNTYPAYPGYTDGPFPLITGPSVPALGRTIRSVGHQPTWHSSNGGNS